MRIKSGLYMEGSFFPENSSGSGVPVWGMSLRAAGSMRFRWGQENENRDAFLAGIAGTGRSVAAVELIHSHTVFAVDCAQELTGCQGDGIITRNRSLMPTVTAADCMPLFLYEPQAQVFGALHSGWKGTGIVRDAILLAEEKYGADRKNFRVVMGPHIHSCCYTVTQERADFFSKNFTSDCVSPAGTRAEDGSMLYALSLADANRAVLRTLGVPEDHIIEVPCCTSCDERFGSFRRETAGLPADMMLSERLLHFTVQAAWVKW